MNRSGLNRPITFAGAVSFSATWIWIYGDAFPVLAPPGGECRHRRPERTRLGCRLIFDARWYFREDCSRDPAIVFKLSELRRQHVLCDTANRKRTSGVGLFSLPPCAFDDRGQSTGSCHDSLAL